MLTTDQLDHYRQTGFVLLKNALDTRLLADIYREARLVFAAQIRHVLGYAVDIDDRDAFESAMFAFFEKDFTAFVNTGKTVQHTIGLPLRCARPCSSTAGFCPKTAAATGNSARIRTGAPGKAP
jgi:hypothetical protein